MAVANETTPMTTLTCTRGDAEYIKALATERGMHQYRVIALLLEVWNIAGEQLHLEAERRLRTKRQTQTA